MRPLLPIVALLAACQSDQGLLSNLPPEGIPNARPLAETRHTDRLKQLPTPEVDVLFVVDNSGSMAEEQDELARNFPVFLDWFLGSGVDYHIGVVSTDMDDPSDSGKLQQASGLRWIQDDTANPDAVFTAMATLGTGGSGTEQGLAATYSALEVHGDAYNAGFRRDEAGLVVVAISDEEDQSGSDLGELIGWLDGMRGPGHDVSFSSIVNVSGFDRGSRYIAVTDAIGGIVWDITTPDWEPLLDQLGIDALGLTRIFHLSSIPVPGTLDVTVTEGAVVYEFHEGVDWHYEQTLNAIVFETFLPEPLSTVNISYDVLAASESAGETE